MKIGIITYHFARNYGAVLQCYALQTYLKNLGHDVYVFNFIDELQRKNNDVIKHGKDLKSTIANVCLFPFLRLIKKKHMKFQSFCENELRLTPNFTNIEELESFINKENYDVIISGSDQVLNCNIEDFNKAFLYPFTTKAKKMFYAASTGNASKEDIASLESIISDFSHIAIREKKDICKFNNKLQEKLAIVCDPVALLREEEWRKMVNKNSSTPYLVCYFLHKELYEKEYTVAQEFAKKMGLEFKAINARFSKKSLLKGTIYDAGPKEFIELLANADYVCTDSFHGTLFSLIFHKKFTSFDTKKNKNDNRRKGLLEEVGALKAFAYIEDDADICEELDYEFIDSNIAKMRNIASSYLEKVHERED